VDNANRLVQRDKVDVLIGTVHSGVQMGIQKVARDSGVLNLIPNAGVHAATRALCAPNVFRTSFTNSQPTLALGKAMVDKGHKKAVSDFEKASKSAKDPEVKAFAEKTLPTLQHHLERAEALSGAAGGEKAKKGA
jgi:ABC-type branched-subunit amino acid transport system substrate-binding protein